MTNTPVIMLPPRSSLTHPSSTATTTSLFDSLQHSLADASSPSTPSSQRPSQTTSSNLSAPMNSPRRDLLVGEWANGGVSKQRQPVLSVNQDWKDVHRNIKQMDQLYDATFYSWLKSEDNVLVTAMYLHRIANEYSLDRLINAIKWLVADWRWESTSILVRHITVGWCGEEGDIRRAQLLRHLTQSWATQYTATLITTILATPPYVTAPSLHRERFLRAFNEGWDFSKLSEFFMYLQSQANIDYKVKCVMLQEAARRERETLGAKLNRRRRRRCQHHDDDPLLSELSNSVTDPLDSPVSPSTDSTCPMLNVNESSTSSEHHYRHHRSAVPFDNHTLERTTSASPPQTCSSPPTSTVTSSSPPPPSSSSNQPSRYQQHHRRISSNDMVDVKRQRFSSSAFDENTDSMDYESNANEPQQPPQQPPSSQQQQQQPQQQTRSNTISCILTSGSSNTTQTSKSTLTIAPSPSASSDSSSSQSHTTNTTTAESSDSMLLYPDSSSTENVSNDLSRLDLGSALHTTSSAATTAPSSSWARQRRRSSSSNLALINNSQAW